MTIKFISRYCWKGHLYAYIHILIFLHFCITTCCSSPEVYVKAAFLKRDAFYLFIYYFAIMFRLNKEQTAN
ncbi:MAG: hypothetical protein EXX96DRAFT_580242 [Benjaminiella poitrasii]|nr:MAG: hypothetical protein EXX96DRAFT_580242 [Benjaminiella poitrasii]